jgi:hypothetical protein
MSMVHDHFRPLLPEPWGPNETITFPPVPLPAPAGAGVPYWQSAPWPIPPTQPPQPSWDEVKAILADFKRAVEAAAVVDTLTGQADCVDPVKAELMDRVAKLEAQMDALLSQAVPIELPAYVTRSEPRAKPKSRKSAKP